jgi:hypothetical protein
MYPNFFLAPGVDTPVLVLILRNLLFKIKYLFLTTMIGEYYCNYLLRTGGVCGRTCRRPEGCHEHWKARKRLPCKVCGKPTSSEPGLCRKHANGYYVTQYINRLRDRALGTYQEVI